MSQQEDVSQDASVVFCAPDDEQPGSLVFGDPDEVWATASPPRFPRLFYDGDGALRVYHATRVQDDLLRAAYACNPAETQLLIRVMQGLADQNELIKFYAALAVTRWEQYSSNAFAPGQAERVTRDMLAGPAKRARAELICAPDAAEPAQSE